jgi:hypothetical protein
VVETLDGGHAFAGQLQQGVGADDVGLDEVIGAHNGAVHVGLGGEVGDGIHLVVIQDAGQGGPVADVSQHEHIAVADARGHIGQALRVAGVGEFVHVDDASREAGFFEQVAYEIAADEAAAAGDQEVLHTVKGGVSAQKNQARSALTPGGAGGASSGRPG